MQVAADLDDSIAETQVWREAGQAAAVQHREQSAMQDALFAAERSKVMPRSPAIRQCLFRFLLACLDTLQQLAHGAGHEEQVRGALSDLRPRHAVSDQSLQVI